LVKDAELTEQALQDSTVVLTVAKLLELGVGRGGMAGDGGSTG
jgi:hypothetical protein